MIDKIKMRFRIGKQSTDVIREAEVQKQNEIKPNANSINHEVNQEQIQIDVGERSKDINHY